MAKLFITLASLSGMFAVIFGAFGAHALKGKLDDQAIKIFETAVQYHFYHSFALLMVGVIALSQSQTVLLKSSGWLFVVGILVFSGSLYLLSLTGVRWLGAITPLGGLALIAGWACLAATSWKLLV
ncbi:MAG: DUF423 domain-containing protein [Halioglobus sp.]|mgnify:CR=1 FL=1